MTAIKSLSKKSHKKADWEIDFYSRPIIEANGKKRWELLISSTEDFSGVKPFRWEKRCPAEQVNSVWLSEALKEAIEIARLEGWDFPSKLRFWRPSMRTMIKKASEKLGIDAISSRRTYSLIEWLANREIELYPKEQGYIAGPIAPSHFSQIDNQSVPLPEAVRGDALTIATLPIGALREANQWPMEFSSLIPIKNSINDETIIPGIRLFSKSRALGLAAWLGGLEPVVLVIEKNQLILEAGQQERWLVTDLDNKTCSFTKDYLRNSKEQADGLQFISVQSTPQEQKFTGFWMMKDLYLN